MSTVQEIERAVAGLPEEEFWELTERILAMREGAWDRELREDAREGGPLDKLARQAIAEFQRGDCKPLP